MHASYSNSLHTKWCRHYPVRLQQHTTELTVQEAYRNTPIPFRISVFKKGGAIGSVIFDWMLNYSRIIYGELYHLSYFIKFIAWGNGIIHELIVYNHILVNNGDFVSAVTNKIPKDGVLRAATVISFLSINPK